MTKEKTGAVITGGDFQALGVLRSLARKDISVVILDSCLCISRYSRYKKKFIKSPCPSNADSYIDFLIGLAEKERIQGWVVFPNSDEAVYSLSTHKDIREKFYRIPTPRWEVIRKVYIKKETYQVAERYEIPIPKTYYPESIEASLEMHLEFPVIIKPSIRPHFYSKESCPVRP